MAPEHRERELIRDFTEGSVMSQLVLFASPLFLSSVLQIAYNMVSAVLRRLGDSKHPSVIVAIPGKHESI